MSAVSSSCRAAGDFELVLGVLDPLLELPAVRLRLACFDLREFSLCRLELPTRPLVVDLLHAHRVVDERKRTIELDLEEPGAGRELENLVRIEVNARRTGLERRDERRMPREDADLTSRAGHDDHLCIPVEHRAVRRDERDVELRMRLSYQCTRSKSAPADSDRA